MFPFIRSLFPRQKNLPADLFAEALRDENSGEFEKAFTQYKMALDALTRSRFQNTGLKKKIEEKLKILNTVIEYNSNSQFRKNARQI